jgi:hypothetical protein
MVTHGDLRSTIARHIEEARRMVTEQKGCIARLKATGVETAFAELTLRALEANLKRFQGHSDWSEQKEPNSSADPRKEARRSNQRINRFECWVSASFCAPLPLRITIFESRCGDVHGCYRDRKTVLGVLMKFPVLHTMR